VFCSENRKGRLRGLFHFWMLPFEAFSLLCHALLAVKHKEKQSMSKSLLSVLCFTLALGGALGYSSLSAAETAGETPIAQAAQAAGEKISINEATAEQLSAAMNGVGLKRRRRLSVIASSTGRLPPSNSLRRCRASAIRLSNVMPSG